MKILFAPLSNFLSHLGRCLCLAEALRAHGHLVEFMTGEKNQDMVARAGFISHPVCEVDQLLMLQTGAPRGYCERLRKSLSQRAPFFNLKRMADDDLAVYDKVHPELVICDARPTTQFTAQMAGIPSFILKNHVGYVNPSLLTASEKKARLECDPAVEVEMNQEFALDCRDLFNNYPPPTFLRPPLLIPGIPEFELGPNEVLPATGSYCFTGPLNWQGWESMKKPDNKRYMGKTVILITLGSSFPFKNLLLKLLSRMRETPYYFIINTGSQFDLSLFERMNQNLEILPFVYLPDYLETADVVIHHGGHGTTMQVLAAGKPALVIPFNGDQLEISRRLEELQLGRRIKKYPDDISSEDVFSGLDELIRNPVYKLKTAAFKENFKKRPEISSAVSFIEETYQKLVHKKKILAALQELRS